jgi:hypothetical protein
MADRTHSQPSRKPGDDRIESDLSLGPVQPQVADWDGDEVYAAAKRPMYLQYPTLTVDNPGGPDDNGRDLKTRFAGASADVLTPRAADDWPPLTPPTPLTPNRSRAPTESFVLLAPAAASSPVPSTRHEPARRAEGLLRRVWRRLAITLVAAPREGWHDLKTIRWARFGKWFAFFCWVSCLGGLVIYLAVVGSSPSLYRASACQPDGKFSIFRDTYSWWAPSSFFQITLGFGNLDFAQAKAVDIAWDVVSLNPTEQMRRCAD